MGKIVDYLVMYLEMGAVYMALNTVAIYYLAVTKGDDFERMFEYLCRRQGLPTSPSVGQLLLYKVLLWPFCAWHVWSNLLKEFWKAWKSRHTRP
jgi:hypothetical protein